MTVPARYQNFDLALTLSKMDETLEYIQHLPDVYDPESSGVDPQRRLETITRLVSDLVSIRDAVNANSRPATNDEIANELELLLLRYSDSERINAAKIGALLFNDTLELKPTILELHLVCALLKFRCKFRPRANDIFDALSEIRNTVNRLDMRITLFQLYQNKYTKYKLQYDEARVRDKRVELGRECLAALDSGGDLSRFDDVMIAAAEKLQRQFVGQ